MTPFNNPSFALLMQALVKPYGICWPIGPDKLTFVSIGTGSYRARLSFTDLGFAGPLKLALHSLLSMMGDTQTLALAQMQWLGDCPDPWPINSDVGTPRRRTAARKPLVPVHALRRDAGAAVDRREARQDTVPRKSVASYRNMDDPSIIEAIYLLALRSRRAAGQGRALLSEA